jgi:hypothetical protein
MSGFYRRGARLAITRDMENGSRFIVIHGLEPLSVGLC